MSLSKNACSCIFIVATFTIAKIWTQIRCAPTEKRLKKNIHRTEFSSTIRKSRRLGQVGEEGTNKGRASMETRSEGRTHALVGGSVSETSNVEAALRSQQPVS